MEDIDKYLEFADPKQDAYIQFHPTKLVKDFNSGVSEYHNGVLVKISNYEHRQKFVILHLRKDDLQKLANLKNNQGTVMINSLDRFTIEKMQDNFKLTLAMGKLDHSIIISQDEMNQLQQYFKQMYNYIKQLRVKNEHSK